MSRIRILVVMLDVVDLSERLLKKLDKIAKPRLLKPVDCGSK